MLALLAAIAFATADDPAKPAAAFKPDPEWKALGKDVWFDPKQRQVVLRGKVALRDGPLEFLLCKTGSKDHESTLTTDAPAKAIHVGLILSKAEVGHAVKFEPAFAPPEGSPIAIELEWIDAKGKTQHADARTWVKDFKTNEALKTDWVFAGSMLIEDPRTKEKIYAAEDGDYACVANFPSAILDLPFRSSASDAERSYVANTPAMPDTGTPVTITLRLRPAKASAP